MNKLFHVQHIVVIWQKVGPQELSAWVDILCVSHVPERPRADQRQQIVHEHCAHNGRVEAQVNVKQICQVIELCSAPLHSPDQTVRGQQSPKSRISYLWLDKILIIDGNRAYDRAKKKSVLCTLRKNAYL